jgi:hypothetical protein
MVGLPGKVSPCPAPDACSIATLRAGAGCGTISLRRIEFVKERRAVGSPGVDDSQASDPAVEAEVDARMELLRSRFPDRLSEEQWGIVRERVLNTITMGQQLRSVALTNADEPEIVFTPYRRPDR